MFTKNKCLQASPESNPFGFLRHVLFLAHAACRVCRGGRGGWLRTGSMVCPTLGTPQGRGGNKQTEQCSISWSLSVCVVLLFCHSCLFCLFVLSNMWTNYNHRALNVPSLEDGCLDLQLANIKRFSGKLAQLCSFSQIQNRPKKGNASRANVWVFSRVYRIQSGGCLPPAVDECLPVNHAKNDMDLKKIWTHAKHAMFCYISCMEMKFKLSIGFGAQVRCN